MIDSLTVSVLLLVALAIAAVVGWDAWRSWRLRQLTVSARPAERAASSRAPGTAKERGGLSRPEPSLGSLAPGGAAPTQDPLHGVGPLDDPEPRLEPARQATEPQSAIPLGPDEAATKGAARGIDGAASGEIVPAESASLAADAAPVTGQTSLQPFAPPGNRAQARAQALGVPPESSAPELAGAAVASASVVGMGVVPGEPSRPAALSRSVLSDTTDAIAILQLSQALGGDRLAAIAQGFRRVGGKPVLLEGLPAAGASPDWETLATSQAYASLRIGVLLANRMGPLNAMEFADFGARVQQIADSLGATVRHPDMRRMLEQARDLDHDSARLDTQICLNVDAAETLSPTQLSALAGPLAIVERGNNRYARLGPRGESLFSVALGDRPNRLSFLLDLPRVDPELQAWPAMLEGIRVAVRRLPGKLVDDNGRPLGDRQIEQIARDLDKRCHSLIEAGLRPGSPAALRVFN